MKQLMVLFAFCGLLTVAGCGGSEPTVIEGTSGQDDAVQQQQYEEEMKNNYGGSGPGSSGPPSN